MPSVITFTSVRSATWSVNRTAYPTAPPNSTPSSSATRDAIVRAATRRGWVWPIMPCTPRPSWRHSFGSWVLLPEPVSPAITTTWFEASASARSSQRSAIGRPSAGFTTPASCNEASVAARSSRSASARAAAAGSCESRRPSRPPSPRGPRRRVIWGSRGAHPRLVIALSPPPSRRSPRRAAPRPRRRGGRDRRSRTARRRRPNAAGCSDPCGRGSAPPRSRPARRGRR